MIQTDPNAPQYNGYTFPASVSTVQFDQEPVFDEADRTVLYVRYRIGLQWYVTATVGNNIDSTIAGLRATLMQRGKVFTYANRGFGADFIVGPANIEDVQGGPKPVAFNFRPKGKNQGCSITWTVEVCIPSNCVSSSVLGVMMTFNFRMGIRIDRHGYSVRTYTGHIAIPKIAGYEQINNADDFLEEIMPPIPEGFQRTDRNFDHNYDKTRCDYTITDEQFRHEAMLPPGCTEASASHEIESNFTKRGFIEWTGSISGNYVVAPPYKIDVAWIAFRELLLHRMEIINANLETGDINSDQKLDEQKPQQKPRVMITSLKVNEPDIYNTNAVSFHATYSQLSSLKAIFGDTEINSGQFRFPSTGISAWNNWVNSIGNVVTPRGLAQMRLDPNAEMIVDLCLNDNPAPPQMDADFVGGDIGGILGDITDLQPEPDIDSSWLLYESELEAYQDHHAIVTSSLIEEPYNPYEQSPGDLTAQGYVPDEKPAELTDQVQYRSPSTLYIYIAGHAMRAWFPIYRPKIVSYNGMQVKEVSTQHDGCYFRSKNVGSLGIGMPIYYAEWRFKYAIEQRPTDPIRPPASVAD